MVREGWAASSAARHILQTAITDASWRITIPPGCGELGFGIPCRGTPAAAILALIWTPPGNVVSQPTVELRSIGQVGHPPLGCLVRFRAIVYHLAMLRVPTQ